MAYLYNRKIKKQSLDGGETWEIVTPIDAKVGTLITTNSDCNDGKITYYDDWLLLDYEYICEEDTTSN